MEVVKNKGEAEKPNALLITVELAEALVKYLLNQKMVEVEALVGGIRGSRAVTVTDGKDQPTEGEVKENEEVDEQS